MTEDELRKECTAMWHKIYDSSTTREQDIGSLMALCKRMQAGPIEPPIAACSGYSRAGGTVKDEVRARSNVMSNFHDSVSTIMKQIKEQKDWEIVTTLSIELERIKSEVLAAASKGENYIDGFPTGALGQALLEELGPGFRANTEQYRTLGLSDGQGYLDDTYIPHTRLMW
jgi:hypothetical protein